MTRYCHTRPCRPVRRRLLAAILWIVLLLAALTAAPSPAPAQGINAGWKFLRVDGPEPPALEAPTADDARWETVVLPHTPRLEKYDAMHPWQGVCWYRKTLLPDPAWNGQRVSLRFGAEITDIASAHAFRYVRYLSPDDGWNNVAEIEFYTSA